MPTANEVILAWSLDRPAWQRDALRRIIQGGDLDDVDIADLGVFCKRGDRHPLPGERQAEHLDAGHFPSNPEAAQSVSLIAIRDVSSVNRLAPDQTLSFGEGLTLVYGENGTGKSGYGRLLKRVCRARHPEPILPDIHAPGRSSPASATFHYRVGGADQPSEAWRDGGGKQPRPHPTLSAISMFDSDCGAVHLRGPTDVAFRPFGLHVPEELVAVCQRVKSTLEAERAVLEKARNAIFTAPPWRSHTAVGKALSELDHLSDPAHLEALTGIDGADQARLALLTHDLAVDPTRGAAEQRLKADRLRHLAAVVEEVEKATEAEAFTSLGELRSEAVRLRRAADLAANVLFGSTALPHVGGDAWRALWEAARRYWEEAAPSGDPFPPAVAGLSCPLCQQSLSEEAANRMRRFDTFVKDETERLADEAEEKFATARSTLLDVDIILGRVSDALAEVAADDLSLARHVRRSMATARLRRSLFLRHGDGAGQTIPDPFPSPVADLHALERQVRSRAAELDALRADGMRKALEAERDELADRTALGSYIDAVRTEIARLRDLRTVAEALDETGTTAVTVLGNRIADQVVTSRLRDRFAEEVVGLVGAQVRVELVRSGGQFGSPYYQVRLLTNPAAKLAEVLSEGEKTCVAIAAFLAELATAPHHSALVFDDPVTSLDHRWRQAVTRRLVEEAKVRQVVVFTHDLVLANDIRDAADSTPFEARHISRSSMLTGIVKDGLPWVGTSTLTRVDELEKRARELLRTRNQETEETYREHVGSFYSRLREAWERALEEVAFAGVVVRHRDYINGKDLPRVAAFTDRDSREWAAAFKRCSELMTGHDPSQGRSRTVPTPEELLQDASLLGDWARSLKERHKAVIR